MKKTIISAFLTVAGCLGALAQTYTNPVFSTYWGSPNINVFRDDDGKFYGFIHEGWGRLSDDLSSWADGYRVAREADHYGSYKIKHPVVRKINGKYIMYYEALNTSTNLGEAICMNVSDNPGGFYETYGGLGSGISILLHKDAMGVHSIWDPTFIQDSRNGRNFIVYTVWGVGVCAMELNADGLSVKSGAQQIRLTGEGYSQPYTYYHDGYFYLFATAYERMAPLNGWTSTMNKAIVVGRSENPEGPYVDAKGNRMLDCYHHTVMAGHPFYYTDPEKPNIVTDDAGQDWVVYNAWEVKANNVDPVMMLDKVRWVNGWPVFADGYPSYYPVSKPVIK